MKDTVFVISRKDESPSDGHTVDEALDIIGRGKYQYYVFLACGILLMATLIETLGISYILAPANCDLELDNLRKGLLTSASFFGIAITSHVSGFLTDEYGRKTTVFSSLIISMLIATVAALTPYFWLMVCLRVISGMCISAASTGAYAYVSEFFPSSLRASSICFASAIGSLSIMYMALAGLLVTKFDLSIPITDSYTVKSWQLHMLINLIPGVLSLVLMSKLPESPKYLMMVNSQEECLMVLRSMYERNTGKSRLLFPVQQLRSACEPASTCVRESSKSLKGFWASIVHETKLIFTPPHLGLILSCSFIQFGCFIVGGGIGVWFPELSNRISKGADNEDICSIFNPIPANATVLEPRNGECVDTVVNLEMYTYNMILGVIYTISFSVLGVCLDKIPLKTTLTAMMLLGTICAVLIQHIQNMTLLLVVFCTLIISFGVSVPLVNATAVDLFPTHLRGMAISMIILVGRMGTVFGANAIGFLLELNCSWSFYGLALITFACVTISMFIPKKNHKEQL